VIRVGVNEKSCSQGPFFLTLRRRKRKDWEQGWRESSVNFLPYMWASMTFFPSRE